MDTIARLLIYFGIFSALTLVLGKIFYFFGVVSGFFEYFYSLLCSVGISRSAILEVSLASSSFCLGVVVIWVVRNFFLGK